MELILFFINLLLITGCHLWAGTKNGKLDELIIQLILLCLVLFSYIFFINYFGENNTLFLVINIGISFVYLIFLFALCKK